jgi:hypothetical protein
MTRSEWKLVRERGIQQFIKIHFNWFINLDSNNLMNSSIPNLTPAECRQSEELNNQMMNCLR